MYTDIITKMSDFVNFLNAFRIEKNGIFSHVGIGNTRGKFYVPSEKMDHFFSEYANALQRNEEVCIMEKHKSISPILVDIDLRYDSTKITTRQHSEYVDDIINVYIEHLAKIAVIKNDFKVYVFERNAPRSCKNDVLKDGLHIIIPNIVTRPSLQLLLRNSILDDERILQIYKKIGSVNPIEDAIDELVIYKNSWMMYGSRKPGCSAYEISNIYKYSANGKLIKKLSTEKKDVSFNDLVKLFSIRNKTEHTILNEEYTTDVSKIETSFETKSKQMPTNHTISSVKLDVSDDFIHQLVMMLSVERSENYSDWVRVGWCLRNISSKLLLSWICFSKKSTKFMDGECEKKWKYMKNNGGLGLGTLHMWAKNDNPVEYQNIIRQDINSLIIKSLSMSHYDIALVIYKMFKYQFVCAGIRNKLWYEFKDHRWHQCDSGYSLRIKISTEVWQEYANASNMLQTKAIQSNEEDQQRIQEQSKKLMEISMKLKNSNFKENIMKECAELFYSEKFEEKLDSYQHLLCFDNGIYDMNTNEFRDGRPEDFMSFSTGCNYIPYDSTNSIIKDIDRFFQQVQPKECKRTYLLKLFASFLCGHIKDHKFHIWTGSGSNGKSVCVELFERAIGSYSCKFPITLLTQKRAASNAATGELARAKGRRLAVLQEPSEDERLHVGLMKELTGGDTIMCRALYKDPIEYKPQYKLILLCNHLPSVPSDDGGTWRRIRVIEFTSKFVENPKEENEFPIDLELSNKFDLWKEHFISMLLNVYYPRIQKKPIEEPEDVLLCTREYQHNNDHVSHFIQVCIEKSDNGFLMIDDAFNELKNWVRDDNVPLKVPKKNEFQKILEKKLGKLTKTGAYTGFKGFKIRNRYSKPSVYDDTDDIDQ